MAYVPIAPNVGAVWRLESPGGSTVAVFNDPNDANYVGAITEATGFDSAEVQELALANVERDGGEHLPFWYGRRPVTLAGLVYNLATGTERSTRLDRLIRASNAVRSDSTLRWTPVGGVEVMLKLRRQQPLRISGGWNKEFQLSMVSASPYIESYVVNTQQTVTGAALPQSITCENRGSGIAFPELIRIQGPITNPRIVNTTTNEVIVELTVTIANGVIYNIDVKNRTVVEGSTDRYDKVDFLDTQWSGLQTGNNTIQMSGTAGGGNTYFRVDWRDAWV